MLPTKASADITSGQPDQPAAPEEKRCEKCECILCCCVKTQADLEQAERALTEILDEIDAINGFKGPR